jgi:hypothetical protein
MPTFDVRFEAIAQIYAEVTVEADTRDEARAQAQQICDAYRRGEVLDDTVLLYGVRWDTARDLKITVAKPACLPLPP